MRVGIAPERVLSAGVSIIMPAVRAGMPQYRSVAGKSGQLAIKIARAPRACARPSIAVGLNSLIDVFLGM